MNKSVIAGAVVVLLIALAGVSIFLVQNIDALLKGLIEQIGSEITQTWVTVDEVKLDLAKGSGSLSGLKIANPEGFSENNLLELGDIAITIDTASLSGPVYVINEISVDGVKVLAEEIGGTTNVQTLLDNIKSGTSTPGDPDEEAEATETPGATESEDILLAIESIDFLNGNVSLKSEILGDRELELIDFRLRQLGSKEKGLTPAELGAEIASQVIVQISAAVTDMIADLTSESLKDKISEKSGEAMNKLKSLFKKGD